MNAGGEYEMSDVYKKIKDIYGDVYCEEFNGMPRYNDYEYAAEYVKSVYNALASTAYANERNDATECLKVGRYVLDEVLIRTIFSNLYCDFRQWGLESTLVSHSNFPCNGSKSLENTTVFPA